MEDQTDTYPPYKLAAMGCHKAVCKKKEPKSPKMMNT